MDNLSFYDIETRTFGVEIEMCDFDRSKVVLPDGFQWNKEEQIYNTDGEYCREYGGEINTPPMILCEESLDKIKSVYTQLKESGGRTKWSIDTHVHLYAGDLTLEQLKKLIQFQYLTYPYFKEYSQLGEWDEIALHGKPLITERKYKDLMNADSMNALKKLLENQSKKGFVRYAINVASVFVRNTVEFRCYNASLDFEEVRNCIVGTVNMFYWALNHTEEDFKEINSYEDFISKMELPLPTPPLMVPLLYQGNPYSAKEAFKTKPIIANSKLCSVLQDALSQNECGSVAVVNSFMYQYELSLWEKYKVSVYTQDKYSHLLYELAMGKKITYSGNLEWLQHFNNDDNIRQVAIALYVYRIMKYVKGSNEYCRKTIASYKRKAEESILKNEQSAKRLIEMLNNVDYHTGNLQDALNENQCVFYSIGKYKNSKRAFRTISDNSDYETDFEDKKTDYYDLVENIKAGVKFFMFSNSPYLTNMHKLSFMRNAGLYRESSGRFLYSNVEQKEHKATMSYTKADDIVEVKCPPDDLDISDESKLVIHKVPSNQFYQLQKKFIKKVDKVSSAPYTFVVMYGDYCVGGVAFDYPKTDKFDLWQLSDFCTNNNIPRLSKLILLCILSKQFKKLLSRSVGVSVRNVITYAYTDAPVSMKYRGLYKKNDEYTKPHKLAYVAELGGVETYKDCIVKYQTYKQNAGK